MPRTGPIAKCHARHRRGSRREQATAHESLRCISPNRIARIYHFNSSPPYSVRGIPGEYTAVFDDTWALSAQRLSVRL